jgi:hypothetical protein
VACYNRWDIGGCGCASCTETFTVLGCNLLPAVGVTVSVFASSGGALLASGTTNGSGQVALAWAGASGNVWVTITGYSSRFNAFAQTVAIVCGSSKTLSLVPAAGYACDPGSGCFLPVKTTLFLSAGILGSATLAYSAITNDWTGTSIYNYPSCPHPGCGCIFTNALTVFWRYQGTGLSAKGWIAASVGSGLCPITANDGSGLHNYATLDLTSIVLTCPPAFSYSADMDDAEVQGCIFCGAGPQSVTITE